ncbi:MAG: family 43 glycosylhydrolase [Acidimicrobiales bacterium]
MEDLRGSTVQRTLALALVGCLLIACGSTSAAVPRHLPVSINVEPRTRTGQPTVPSGRSPTLGPQAFHPSEDGGVQLDVVNALRYGNPVFNGDFADPFALKTAQALYLFATDTTGSRYAPGANIPEIELTQSSAYEGYYVGDALPRLPSWTVRGFQWAPAVWARPDGTYVMYYSTPATNPSFCSADPTSAGCVQTVNGLSSAMCISAATSTNPVGPYVDDSSSAFVCPSSKGGAIDPSLFVAQDGTPWLLWKSDGDCCRLPTAIYSQQLTSDGLSTVGPPHRLIGASQPWEGGLVEGPSMVESDGEFWLFYSANLWGTDHYGIGIARCRTVTGPCTKPLDQPWFGSSGRGNQTDPGPGGQEFFQAGGLVWMVHHGLAPGQTGDLAQRRLFIDLVAFPDGQKPRIVTGDAAAALAEGVLYDNDPNLPAQPRSAYLTVLTKKSGAFAGISDDNLVTDGSDVCRALGNRESSGQILGSTKRKGLTAYEAYVLAIFATKYLCPQYAAQALVDVRQGLMEGP